MMVDTISFIKIDHQNIIVKYEKN